MYRCMYVCVFISFYIKQLLDVYIYTYIYIYIYMVRAPPYMYIRDRALGTMWSASGGLAVQGRSC